MGFVPVGGPLFNSVWRGVFAASMLGMVSKMDSTQIVLTLVIFALIYAGQSVWRAHFQKEKEIKTAEIQSKQVTEALEALKFASETDLKRMEIFSEAMNGAQQLEPWRLTWCPGIGSGSSE